MIPMRFGSMASPARLSLPGPATACVSGTSPEHERQHLLGAGDDPAGFPADLLPEDVKPEVLERIIAVATELGVEGREGRPAILRVPLGTVVAQEKVATSIPGAEAWRIAYVSSDMQERPTVSTALVMAPRGAPPREGRPIMSWAVEGLNSVKKDGG